MKALVLFLAALLCGCATYTIHSTPATSTPVAAPATPAPGTTITTLTCPITAQPVWNGAQWICLAPPVLYGSFYNPYPLYSGGLNLEFHYHRHRRR